MPFKRANTNLAFPSCANWLFSAKAFLAAMTAFWFSIWVGLDHPYWSIVSAYITAQPFAGAVLSKGSFRAAGTLVGAAASVFIVTFAIDSAVMMTLLISLWISLCAFTSLLDRSPRSYAFILAGYTAAIISFPSVLDPQDIFSTALDRTEEILLGIVCGMIAHTILFPISARKQTIIKVETLLQDTKGWILNSLDSKPSSFMNWPQKLSLDLYDLHNLVLHLSFEIGSSSKIIGAIRLLQARLSTLLPLVDGLAAAKSRLSEDEAAAIFEIRQYFQAASSDQAMSHEAWMNLKSQLQDKIQNIALRVSYENISYADMIFRLAEVSSNYQKCIWLASHLDEKIVSPWFNFMKFDALRTHQDYDLALCGALGAFCSVSSAVIIWIVTGWQDGGSAAIFAGIWSALFSSLDNAKRVISQILIGTVIASFAALFYASFILPYVTDFFVLLLSLAPALLIAGSVLPRAKLSIYAAGFLIAFPSLLDLQNNVPVPLVDILNVALAQCLGICIAIFFMTIFRTGALQFSTERLVRQCDAELLTRLDEKSDISPLQWSFTMLDRIAFLSPRFVFLRRSGDAAFQKILRTIRAGVAVSELQKIRKTAKSSDKRMIAILLSRLQRYLYARGDAEAARKLKLAFDRILCATTFGVPDQAWLTLQSSTMMLYASLFG